LKTIIISHESDVDGVFSASIALMRFPQAKVFFTSYGKENIKRISEILYKEIIVTKECGQVIISDLGLNDDMIDLFKEIFIFLKSNLWSITWVDHHPWSQKAIKSATEVGLVKLVLDKSEKQCASDLMYNTYLLGNSVAEWLSKIAHATDFVTKDLEIPPLPELIIFYKTFPDFYHRISELTKKISRGTLWDTEMQEDYHLYSKLRDIAKERIFDKIKTIETENGIKVSIVPTSPYLQISLFSEEVFKKTGADVAFYYNQDGKISIRRNNNIIECDKIAKQLLEGGGHKFAAGGKLKSNPDEVDSVIDEIKNSVKNVTSTTSNQNP
jgi:oligoribonuclease NrnB/cAMP/cGMP phosphodiesterase (DHH superfamily)